MSKSPAPVDYAAQAREQGVANLETARFNAISNRPQTYTPYGNQIWTKDPNDPNRDVLTQTLSPEQQRLYTLGTGLQAQGLETLQGLMPQLTEALKGSYTLPGQAATEIDRSHMPPGGIAQQIVGYEPKLQEQLDFSRLGAMPTADQATRQAVTEALYKRQQNMLDPQWQQQEADQEVALRNEGLQPGSEAYDRALLNLRNARQSAYSDARLSSITGGGEEMARDFGLQMAARQQGAGEIAQGGQFANAAQQQAYQQLMGKYQFWNQAQAQGFNQALAEAQLRNAGRMQQYQEMTASRTLPINVFNALLTQGQVQNPQFQQYNNNIQAAPPPIFDAATAQGNFNLGAANSQNAMTGQAIGAVGGIAAAALI